MAALGRILQIVGWLWLIVGFFGPMFGLLSLNLLPGIILVFVARVIRKQAERSEMPELGEPPSDREPETAVRRQAREPETRDERPRRAPPEPYDVAAPSEPQSRPEPEPEPEPEPLTSQEMLERIVGVRDESPYQDEMPAMPGEALDEESRKPMSSAEMIARAHQRWDSKPH